MKKLSLIGILLLSACVTINIYFPAAAAEKAADEIIKDIQDAVPQAPLPLKPESRLDRNSDLVSGWLDVAIGVFVTSAEAAEVDLSIDSAAIRQLRAGLEKRFPTLQLIYEAGFIGIQNDGQVVVRPGANIPLKERNLVNKLVAAENKDRLSLYRAIADANGHPEWVDQIKKTFAERWISNAHAGWWRQKADGSWQQK